MEPLILKLQGALRKHYWNRLAKMKSISQNIQLKPFNDMVDYVAKAHKAALDETQECALAGSKLLDSVLQLTCRRFASNVEEANELFLAGMNMEHYLWNELNKMKGNMTAFQARVDEISALLPKEFATAG